VGLYYFNISNFKPFTLDDQGGIFGTAKGAAIIFTAYIGYDFITTLS